ncbi:MAG TPA: acyl-CoA dehydrogenase family protein [Chloroflexia bacterium]|nr:acyl-CoA dehydrogenase family protein [Chloroflexia bacterium]
MYRLNEEQTTLVETISRLADEKIAPFATAVDAEGRFPAEAMEALAEAGFYGLNVPKEYGGLGQGIGTACAVLDQIAQRCASTAMIYLMHLCGTICYVSHPEGNEETLRQIAEGKHLTTLAWSERGSRSHFWAPVSQATQQGEEIELNASKSWVTSAGYASSYIISTRTAGGTEPTDTMLYTVFADDPGVSVSGPWNGLGMRGNASAPMQLSHTVIPASRALCEISDGFNTMLGVVLPWFALGNAAVSIGNCEAAVKATTAHLTASKLEHLGQSLADLPNLRARLAEMRIETDRARAHLVSVIDSVENPGPATTLMVLEIKAAAGESALKVTDLGMLTCGGAAFSRHLTIERNFRDARAAVVMAPTADVLKEFIGRALLGMSLF